MNVDGSGLQLIGDADVSFDDGGSSNLIVNWVPGSRRLSINLDNILYYLDVNWNVQSDASWGQHDLDDGFDLAKKSVWSKGLIPHPYR